jgi:hypothetical protein
VNYRTQRDEADYEHLGVTAHCPSLEHHPRSRALARRPGTDRGTVQARLSPERHGQLGRLADAAALPYSRLSAPGPLAGPRRCSGSNHRVPTRRDTMLPTGSQISKQHDVRRPGGRANAALPTPAPAIMEIPSDDRIPWFKIPLHEPSPSHPCLDSVHNEATLVQALSQTHGDR